MPPNARRRYRWWAPLRRRTQRLVGTESEFHVAGRHHVPLNSRDTEPVARSGGAAYRHPGNILFFPYLSDSTFPQGRRMSCSVRSAERAVWGRVGRRRARLGGVQPPWGAGAHGTPPRRRPSGPHHPLFPPSPSSPPLSYMKCQGAAAAYTRAGGTLSVSTFWHLISCRHDETFSQQMRKSNLPVRASGQPDRSEVDA